MKWRDMRRSDNVQDARGVRGPVVAGGLGIGGLLVVLLISALTGTNPADIINTTQGAQAPSQPSAYVTPGEDRDAQFVESVLGDTEDTWSRIFQQQLGQPYRPATLVLFSDAVTSACGNAQASMGPFYCPLDEKVYLDMTFFSQIKAAAGPDADFARAYAISHEVGHHIQHVLGILSQVQSQQQQVGQEAANDLQVRTELQADCFAGIWGHYTAQKGLINSEDVKGAMDTAAQIGDDYLQRRSQGYVVPESFTHGSSEQRVEWFRRGLQTGDVKQCDTFK